MGAAPSCRLADPKVFRTNTARLSFAVMYTAANITVGEIAKAIGAPSKTVESWVQRGIIKPTHRGIGHGHYSLFSLRDVVAIAVLRDLRQRGMPTESAAAAANWLMARDIDELSRNWSVGRRLLLIVGHTVLPVLATKAELFENPSLDIVAASTSGVPVAIVDTEAAYNELNGKIVANREGREHKPRLGALPVEASGTIDGKGVRQKAT